MKYWKWILLISIGLIVLGAYVAYWEFRKPELEVYFFHLNRGRSIFIRTPQGKTILIDGGQSGDIIRELTRVFPFYRRRIDVLIYTSSAPKNVGGLGEVVKRFEIYRVIGPSVQGTSTALSLFEKAAHEKGYEIEKMERGDGFVVDGVTFRVLFPDPHFKFNKTSMPELVLQVEYDSTSLLLLGDVSRTIQKSFVGEVEKGTLVEYAHSAGDSRVSSELFSELDPDYIIVTKKETARASSQSKKKFDLNLVPSSKVINLDQKGTARLTF